jgi:hypothetical protein
MLRFANAAKKGVVLAKGAAQLETTDPIIAGREFFDRPPGAVASAILNEYYFKVAGDLL